MGTFHNLELINISKKFSYDVLKDLNIEVNQGDFISILGPSGCGKSTIFRLILNLDQNYDGDILINEKNILSNKYHVGYMAQKDLLLPFRNVVDNILLPLELRKEKISQKKLQELISLFGLEGSEKQYPHQLSGGMKQRASLLRTMMMNSDFLLLDEPFGALDALTKHKLQIWLLEVYKQIGLSILFITHDIDEAIFLSNKIYILSDKPSKVKKVIDIDFTYPRDKSILTTSKFNNIKKEILDELV